MESSQSIICFSNAQKYMKLEHLDQLTGFNNTLEEFNERSSLDYALLDWLGFFETESQIQYSAQGG